MSKREKDGYRSAVGWYCLFLAEVYLQIVAGKKSRRFLFC